MYDEGPHIVLRRDGVCIVAKTPDGDMPQIEYWGRDFAFDTAGDALRQCAAECGERGHTHVVALPAYGGRET